MNKLITVFSLPLFITLFVFFISSCSLNPEIPAGYVLLYGISQYDPGYPEGSPFSNNLIYPDDDVYAMGELFRSMGYTVTERINEEATLYNLKQDITGIKEQIDINESFIFYFSGHGAQDIDLNIEPSAQSEPEYSDPYNEWIFLFGSLTINGIGSLDAAVNDDGLRILISDIPSYRKMIILDSCNSGGFIGNSPIYAPENDSSEEDKSILEKTFNLYLKYPSSADTDIPANMAVVLSAAGELEYSVDEISVDHGLFTYLFLNSADSDYNNDGYITLYEIYNEVSLLMQNNWSYYNFSPRISGSPVDFVLFTVN